MQKVDKRVFVYIYLSENHLFMMGSQYFNQVINSLLYKFRSF